MELEKAFFCQPAPVRCVLGPKALGETDDREVGRRVWGGVGQLVLVGADKARVNVRVLNVNSSFMDPVGVLDLDHAGAADNPTVVLKDEDGLELATLYRRPSAIAASNWRMVRTLVCSIMSANFYI